MSDDKTTIDDLHEELAQVRDHIVPDWDEEATERALAGVERRREIRRRQNVVVASAAVLLLAGVAAIIIALLPDSPPPTAIDDAVAEKTEPKPARGTVGKVTSEAFSLANGSTVEPAKDALVELLVDDDETRVRLHEGRAHFEIFPSGPPFYVLAGHVEVEVEGTTFDVERTRDEIAVYVVNGTVRVRADGSESTLTDGEKETWEPRDVGAVPIIFDEANGNDDVALAEAEAHDPKLEGGDPESEGAARETAEKTASKNPAPRSPARWESLARSGDWKSAAAELDEAKPRSTSELLLASDVRRYSGDPEGALPFLAEVAKRHHDEARGALAQFQRARILQSLGRHAEAAELFAEVGTMPASGSVAEDALSREVEALYRAGQRSKAAERARAYLETYPNGYRTDRVRRFGGVE